MNAQKIGEFIKSLRKEKNLTQKELAENINCTDKAVSRWETGRGIPEISMLIPLSKVLDVSVNELLMGERIEKEELPQKTEQLIVETITHNNKKLSNMKTVIFVLLCIIQFIVIFVTPATAGPGDEMGIVFFLFLGTLVNSFILGLTPLKLKTKALFSLVVIGLFIPSVFLVPIYSADVEIFALYIPALLIFTFVGILIGTAINKAVNYIIKNIRN